MKLNFRRLLAMFLSIVMVAGMLPAAVFAEDAVETPTYVAKVNGTECSDATALVSALETVSGEVTVEVYGKITTSGISLNNANITKLSFVGKDTDAEICVDGVSYIDVRYTSYPIEYTSLILSHINAGQNIDGFLPQYFSTYNGGNVTYTSCTFPNGVTACGSTANTTYTFNQCIFNNTTSGLYSLWVYGNSTNVVINGGTFSGVRGIKMYSEGSNDFSTLSVTDATFSNTITEKPAIVLTKGESITLTGNTFENTTGTVQVDDNYVSSIEGKTVTINGKAYTVNSADKKLDEVAPAAPAVVEVTTYEELLAALETDNAKIKMMKDITATATEASSYGKAGIVLGAGDVLDGNGKTLTINGANSTWDCAIAMTGGEVKNLTIAGAMRGVFMPGANGDVVIDNCIFKDVVYTFNSDAGSKNYTVTIKNTTLNGWTSFSDVHKSVTFEECSFGEGNGYQFCRPYQATTFVDCVFADGYKLDTANVKGGSENLEFTDCTYAGAALSADNNAMFYNGGSVVINGVPTDVTPPTGSNSYAYTTEVDGNVHVWGEGGGNAKKSYVLKLYSGETLIATTTLNNEDGIINGDVYVTWHFFYPESTDEYWTTTWEEGHPNADAQPTKVELWIDGTLVATTEAKMSGADGVNPVVWDKLGGVKKIVTGLSGTGTAEDPFLINNLEELKWFRDDVNTYTQDGSNQYKGKYVKLTADIDLDGINWTPIGTNTVGDHAYFKGIFYGEKADGTIPTISNLYINADGDHLGFFARVGSYAEGITPTVKNLKFHNVNVSSNTTTGHGGSYVGGVIANAGGNSVVSGIEVAGDVYVAGYGYVGGIVGHGYPDIDNCHVSANDGSYIHGYYWCVGGIIGYAGEGGTPITNSSVSGVDIWSAYGAAAAVAGLLQDGNKVENVSASKVEITSNSDYCMGYIAGNGECSTMTNITANNVTVTAKGNPITSTDAVASVNGTIYFDLQSAINAAKDNETVVLLRDVVLEGQNINGWYEGIYYTGDKSFTLDLGGHSITCADTVNDYAFNIKNLGTEPNEITIKNGTITGGTAVWSVICVGSSAELYPTTVTLEGVTVNAGTNSQWGDLAIKVRGASTVNLNSGTKVVGQSGTTYVAAAEGNGTLNIYDDAEITACAPNAPAVSGNGTVNIYGGTITATNGAYAVYTYSSGTPVVNIYDGTITGDVYAHADVANYPTAVATVDISGGTINGALVESYYGTPTGECSKISVTGGTFDQDPTAYVATGYKAEENEGIFSVVKSNTIWEVATKAELADAVAKAQAGDTILLTADIDYGTDHLAITQAITLDLGTHTLTTRATNYGLALKNDGCIVTNGTLKHAGTVAAIKVWNAKAITALVIDVTGTSSKGNTIDGIVIQENAAGVDLIQNVTIHGTSGQGVDSGIKTYNCGNATEPVIGSMENVTIDARSVGLNISAPCGTATNCSIKGGINGIEIWIKGTYSATLDLFSCNVEGGVFAHDEFSSDPSIVNNGTLKLKADAATTGVSEDDITLTIARAENVEGILKDVMDNAQAKVNDTYYATLAEAIAAAQNGDIITLIWAEGDAPIAMNGAVYGKTVTITGTATVDWSKGNLFVGRGGEGNGTVIFDNANLTSASDSSSYGIHVSGRQKNTPDKYDGTLVIKNSTIELDYLINRGTINVDNSILTVKNGFGIAGRPASETESGTAATATVNITNGSYVKVLNHNGMGVGVAADINEGYGVLNLTDSTFECASFNINGDKLDSKTLGDFNVYGESTLKINTLTGREIDLHHNAIIKDSTVGGEVMLYGKVTFRGANTFAMLCDYGAAYSTDSAEWLVEKDASVTLTDKARYGLGYGDKVVIYGDLTNALTARETLTDDDIVVFMHGLVAMSSWNVENSFEVNNAYVVIGSNNSFGNTSKDGYTGKYTFAFNNSVVDFSRVTFYNSASTTELIFNKSDVRVGQFMNRDADSVFYLINSKVLSTSDINGTDEGNYLAGMLVLNNSSLSYEAPLVMESGSLTLGAGSRLIAPSITGTGKIIIDATGMTAGKVEAITANASGFTGTLEVINNAKLTAEINENGNIVLVAKEAELFDIAKTNMIMGQNLALMFAFEKSNIADADLSGYVAKVSIAYKDDRGTVNSEIVSSNWTTVTIGGVDYWCVTVSNLAAKEMDDDVTVTIYKGEEAISKAKTMSLRQYGEERLAASTDNLFKTTVVDMLNYGAEAQKYFEYNENNLANRNISAYQNLATTTVTLDKTRNIISDENNHFIASNVTFTSDIAMLFAIARESTAVSGKITFVNHKNGTVTTFVDSYEEIIANGKAAKKFVFTGMVVADIDQVISVEFYDAEENVVISLTDSLDAYLGRVGSTSRMKALADAFGKFSTSAYAYLHK